MEVWIARVGDNIDAALPTHIVGVFQHRESAEKTVLGMVGDTPITQYLETPISTEWDAGDEVYAVELYEVRKT